MGTQVIDTPGGIPFAGFYYPEILRELLQDLRENKEAIGLTDENEFEVHVQMLRAFSLVGHLNNTRLDTAVTELLIDSAGLLESVKKLLRLMGIELAGATPAVVDVIAKLTEVSSLDSLDFIPDLSSFATESVPPINYECDAMDLDRTDRAAFVFGYYKTESNTNGDVFSTSPDLFRRQSGVWALDVVGQHLFVSDSNFFNGGEYRVTQRLNDTDLKVVKVPGSGNPGFLTETDLSWTLRKIRGNYNSEAAAVATPFNPWPVAPSLGDMLFVGHVQAMVTQLDFELIGAAASQLGGVWEYFDNERSLLYPTTVTDNGSTLTFDLTTLLGPNDATGAEVTVEFTQTGTKEVVTSVFAGGRNQITTDGLLGQTTPSTDQTDYLVTAEWVPFENVNDGTNDGNGSFSQEGAVSWDLPQTRERSWLPSEVNLEEGFFVRWRYTNEVAPSATNVTFDLIYIDRGDQFITRTATQGETIGPQTIGSSTGAADQQFRLPESPYIDDSELIEVDESGGGVWYEYRYVKSFLNSTSTSRHYMREVDALGRAKIIFGDGDRGKVPPAGISNVRATYRTFGLAGDTEDGNVGVDQVIVNADGVGGITEVTNPRPAYGWRIKDGGTDADLKRIKRDKPAELRVRGTASTPEDAAYLAINEFTDDDGTKPVSRAFAEEEKFGLKTVGLIVVGAGGTTLSQNQIEDLDLYFNGDRYAVPPVQGTLLMNYQLTSLNFEPKLIAVEATVTWKGGSIEAVRNALLSLITPLAVEDDELTYVYAFGGYVSHSRLITGIHAVDPAIRDVPVLKLNGLEQSVTLGPNELPITTASNISINLQEA